MIDLCILWHMHQPRYVHPLSGRPALPWVRLHACASYLDMARALEKRPEVRVTVNFVPSLVEQLEAMLSGEKDDLERIAEKNADSLDDEERRFVVSRSFSVRWNRVIDPRPRYGDLLAKREAPGRFTTQDVRDLECLFLFGWLGFAAREDDPAIGELDRKGSGFTEDDKRVLLAAVRAAAGAVLPAWRRLAGRGQVELSTSPYYHPIVPLLIDSETARRARPGDTLPPRFAYPEDAREQIRRGQALHDRVFGDPARGMWPPEGSLSPEAVALYGECGVAWLAGDEETLARSLDDSPAHRVLGPRGPGRARTRVWRHAGVDLVFRDRELSDRIGFRYSELPAVHAAADLLAGVRALGGGEDDGHGRLVGLFLDGENAWESYEQRGADFLYTLYGELEHAARAGAVRTRTLAEAVAEHGPGAELPRLHSGSWIDAAFRIWIGDPDKNRAWTRLGRARERLAAAERAWGAADPRVERARTLLLAAEGSDWFWWFGEPFSSAEDPLYDAIFRAHLERAWRELGDEPPGDLAEPIGEGRAAAQVSAPTGLITPHMDGKGDRFFEWHGAARYDIGRGGAMADGTHPIERVHVGFDLTHLYLRLDPLRADRRRVAAARMLLRTRTGSQEGRVLAVQLGAPDGGPALASVGGRVAALDVVEVAIPFLAIGAAPKEDLRLFLTLEFAGVPLARVPRDGVISVTVPWPGWEDENWSA